MTGIGADSRVIDGAATAWFDAPSLTDAAALAGRIVEMPVVVVVVVVVESAKPSEVGRF